MKIVLLSGASSIHTIRWANGLAEAGHEVHVISQQAQLEPMDSRVQVHCFPFRGVLGYFTMVPAVKKLLLKLSPILLMPTMPVVMVQQRAWWVITLGCYRC